MIKGYVRVAALSDLPEESAKQVVVGNTAICLAHTDGRVMAISDECSHSEVSLSDGEVDHGTVECWLHGSRFDLRTGNPTGLPATEAVPVYSVRIVGDDVYVAVKE